MSFGLAAIVIKSADDLMLGPDAELTARGRYYTPELIGGFWNVDDRAGVEFLDVPDNIPPGGALRDEGSAFDAAIYLASTNGNVDVSGPVSIMSRESVVKVRVLDGGGWQCVPKGAMIIDAYDTVTFDGSDGVPGGGVFENSLANGEVGDRLEVVSRITEWLEDAVGRLPFPGDLVLPDGYSYVMRGAGAENPAIGPVAPAWVLESRLRPTPLIPQVLGAQAEKQAF